MKLILFCLLTVVSSHALSPIDKTDTLLGVQLESGKDEAVRSYKGRIERTFNYPLELVKKAITNFSEKCNNEYKSKREFTDAAADCKYHNDHLIETIVVKDLRPDRLKDLSEAWLLGRRAYNRGTFAYYELATVTEGRNDKNQRTLTISLRMLTDEEVKNLTEPKFSKDSVFETSDSTFTLTETAEKTTEVNFQYSATTRHWLLNKEVSVPQVFSSISKSLSHLMSTIQEGADAQKRQIASR